MHNGADGYGGSYGGPSEDVIEIEFLDNGVIRTTTDPISGANHTNAEGLLASLATLAGGPVEIAQRHGHHHHHGEEHNHVHQQG